MIGFESQGHVILPQTVKVKGEEIEVACKACRWSPRKDKKTGEISFVLGKHWSYRVLLGEVEHPNNPPIQVKLMMERDQHYGICIEWPKVMVQTEESIFTQPPIFKDSKKKPKDDPKARQERFGNLDNGLAYLNLRFGEVMGETLMILLMEEYNGCEKKEAA